ncbi:MAG: hypothetical protein ACMUIP_13165 [bacterium]
MGQKKRINNIREKCFWEYNFKNSDIKRLAHSSDQREKKFLFGKIFENSDDILNDLKIFSHEDLLDLIKSYKVPQFNHNYFNRKYLIVKNYFTGERVHIPELSW